MSDGSSAAEVSFMLLTIPEKNTVSLVIAFLALRDTPRLPLSRSLDTRPALDYGGHPPSISRHSLRCPLATVGMAGVCCPYTHGLILLARPEPLTRLLSLLSITPDTPPLYPRILFAARRPLSGMRMLSLLGGYCMLPVRPEPLIRALSEGSRALSRPPPLIFAVSVEGGSRQQ